MIKYATAIRSGTASTEAILRRFTRANALHPTYQAMLEVGRAQRTIFVARYLRDRDLQREINEGLNVVESWNRANSVIFFGKGGDIASNRRDEQELSVLCLRVLQAALVYVNTLMVQDVLADDGWADAADRRGPARPDPAVLDPRRPLRRGQARHEQSARTRRSRAARVARRLRGRGGRIRHGRAGSADLRDRLTPGWPGGGVSEADGPGAVDQCLGEVGGRDDCRAVDEVVRGDVPRSGAGPRRPRRGRRW